MTGEVLRDPRFEGDFVGGDRSTDDSRGSDLGLGGREGDPAGNSPEASGLTLVSENRRDFVRLRFRLGSPSVPV